MSENENTESENTETTETDVETAEQPEGSQPTEVPAAEPVEAPEEQAQPAEEPEASAEPAAETPAAEEAPAAEEPAPPAGPEPKKRKLKHIPRPERRQRPKPVRAASGERKPIVRLEKPEHERGRRQERRGVVVSDAMDKTIVVKVDSAKAHQRYKKVVRRSVKFHAHDPENQAHVGDVVRIVETRPISKSKNWRLAEILEVAK